MSANLANILGITRSDIMFKDEKEIMESKLPKIHEIPIELIDPLLLLACTSRCKPCKSL